MNLSYNDKNILKILIILGGNVHKTPKYRGYFFVYKMVFETFRPPFKEVSCMKMNKNVPNFPTYRGSPFIETQLIEVPLYLQYVYLNVIY